MNKNEIEKRLRDASLIVEQLHDLLHEDALHRLDLFQKYGTDSGETKWSPDLYKRCQLVDALRRKLDIPSDLENETESNVLKIQTGT